MPNDPNNNSADAYNNGQVNPVRDASQVPQNEAPTSSQSDAESRRFSRKKILSLFVEWLATPEQLRDPQTQRAFAEKYGIRDVRVYEWKARTDVQDRVRRLVSVHAHSRYAAVMEALFLSATQDRNPQSIKLFLQHVMNWSERTESTTELKNKIEVSFGDEMAWFSKQEKPPQEERVN